MNNNGKKVYPIPKKLEFQLSYLQLKQHRKLNCIFYDICLDHASTFKWESFSCFRCKNYFTKENNPNKRKIKLRCIKLKRTIKL